MPISSTKKLFILFVALFTVHFSAFSQCNWQTEVSDDFEYTTICPYLIPGTTVHNTPQQFAVHGGSYSLYLNFINCTGGTGTCAGDKVFERKFVVCPFQRYRASAWLTTSFSGTQCNMHIKVTDNSGTVLNDQLQLLAPYAPSWIQYQSGDLIPQSDTLIFTMYTNVGGGGGNDLSMDDFLFEKCLQPYTGTTSTSICTNATPVNLFGQLIYTNDTTGTWSGASPLSGGYQGTFDPLTNITGAYIYNSFPYGQGCPAGNDTINATADLAPVADLGPDTTICTTQNIVLNPNSGNGNTYLWNNGVTGPTLLAFNTSGLADTVTYSVTVTAQNGCAVSDSVDVIFVVCSSLDDLSTAGNFSFYPNPATGFIKVKVTAASAECIIYDMNGRIVQQTLLNPGEQQVDVSSLVAGNYSILTRTSRGEVYTAKLQINQ
ncbi:MAG TPA: T9SS type A sorting domain-containing protein [Bacteroidia bacterium]|nr:T9SS type A sorting domain-containing protein [Bacteroidia bacterium]